MLKNYKTLLISVITLNNKYRKKENKKNFREQNSVIKNKRFKYFTRNFRVKAFKV